jgi:putative transposase
MGVILEATKSGSRLIQKVTLLIAPGSCFDNIFVERLWRTVKQEEVYVQEYLDVWEAEESLSKYFYFYNYRRPHQSLGYKTPFEIYQKGLKIKENKGAQAANF